MDIININDREEKKVESFPYKGKSLKVHKVGIRWLSQAGPEDSPEYGLRYFTVGPGGEIPIHKHFYVQTMYILSGRLICWAHDPDTDEKIHEQTVGPDDAVFIPSMEAHSMKNLSETEGAAFLCCIANVYPDDDASG
ncbi:MAG: cupin domain-containing protein [Desulfatiglandaceae bacterium]